MQITVNALVMMMKLEYVQMPQFKLGMSVTRTLDVEYSKLIASVRVKLEYVPSQYTACALQVGVSSV